MIAIAILVAVVVFLVGGYLFAVNDSGFGIALMLIALLVGGAFISLSVAHYNERTLTCTVSEKDRGYDSQSDSSNYRIYTDECGTFVNEDSFLRGKFNSADVQGQLDVGKTYELTVAGPRFGPFSWFPNIYKVREVD